MKRYVERMVVFTLALVALMVSFVLADELAGNAVYAAGEAVKTWALPVTTVLAALWALYLKYQVALGRIMLRIEKDSADGDWSNKDKEDEVIYVIFDEVLQALPLNIGWLVKTFKFVLEPIIRWTVRGMCALAGKIARREAPAPK